MIHSAHAGWRAGSCQSHTFQSTRIGGSFTAGVGDVHGWRYFGHR